MCTDSSGGRISADLLRTKNLSPLNITVLLASTTAAREFYIPAALNSTLTNPFKGPFSETMTRSEVLSLTVIEARKATPSGSYGSSTLRTEVEKADLGTQNCGKYLCSQTCSAEVVSKR